MRRCLATVARECPAALAIAAAALLAVAGCASGPGPLPRSADVEDAPYVGVFTGEYVDGRPLYRFPPVHVVGSRTGADAD